MTKEIPLTNGGVSLVDDDWYGMLSLVTWHGWKHRSGKLYVKCATKSLGRFRTEQMHRIIMDAPIELVVDHISGNTLDNRRSNLRLCTPAQNAMNVCKRAAKLNDGRYKGACWHPGKQKWQAGIRVNRRLLYLGQFDTQEEAALAYNRAAALYFGEYAALNQIPDQTTIA